MGALASAAMVWRSADYGYYQRLMAAAAQVYATSVRTIARCAATPTPGYALCFRSSHQQGHPGVLALARQKAFPPKRGMRHGLRSVIFASLLSRH